MATKPTLERFLDLAKTCDERGFHHRDAVCERLSLIAGVLIAVLAELSKSKGGSQ